MCMFEYMCVHVFKYLCTCVCGFEYTCTVCMFEYTCVCVQVVACVVNLLVSKAATRNIMCMKCAVHVDTCST